MSILLETENKEPTDNIRGENGNRVRDAVDLAPYKTRFNELASAEPRLASYIEKIKRAQAKLVPGQRNSIEQQPIPKPKNPLKRLGNRIIAITQDKNQYKYTELDLIQSGRTENPLTSIEGYIDSGLDKDVFAYDDGLVVKVVKPQAHNSLADQVAPLIAGSGNSGLEQLQAADSETGVIITDLRPGKSIVDVEPEEILAIKDEHLLQFDDTLQFMREHGLHPHNIAGLLLDRDRGFSFVDYGFEEGRDGIDKQDRGKIPPTREYLEYILSQYRPSRYAREDDFSPSPPTPAGYAPSDPNAEARATILERWEVLHATKKMAA